MEENKCMRPEYGKCCCSCAGRATDYHHCCTNQELRKETGGCVCSIPKGFLCLVPEMDGRVHSGWTEHGICEMWSKKK